MATVARWPSLQVAFQAILLRSNANTKTVHRHARFHGLSDQALNRFETIYRGEGNLRCRTIQLFV
jgi:hypothetical protein